MKIEYRDSGRNQVQFISDFFFITIIFGDVIEYKYIDTHKIVKLKSNTKISMTSEVAVILQVLEEYKRDGRVKKAYNELVKCI